MTSDSPLISICSDIFVPSQWIGRFSTVHSTVGEKFAAKVRNSLPRVANAELQKYLASATLCNTAKTSAKTLSRIRNPLRYPAELPAQSVTVFRAWYPGALRDHFGSARLLQSWNHLR